VTDRPPLRPICLIGPPAAGKTTLAEALSRALDTPVLRPRDVINRAVGIRPATTGLFPRDARGHVPDESLGFALRACLDRMGGTVIFESLPWDAIQLADMYRVAGDRVLVLHLDASDELVTERRVGRQYCGRPGRPNPRHDRPGRRSTTTRPASDAHQPVRLAPLQAQYRQRVGHGGPRRHPLAGLEPALSRADGIFGSATSRRRREGHVCLLLGYAQGPVPAIFCS
jgi:adenylate kinase family enzyme